MVVSGNPSVSRKKSQVPNASKKEDHKPNASSGNPDVADPTGPYPRKRTKDPGVRIVGGRIYDSANGRTCHQCRQKTMGFTASCKNMKKDKQCTIRFCHKCLLNRYGENTEEMSKVDSWTCPKCRGICNCSFCMKTKGQQPTGILTHTAKATGFSSVSEMLLCGVDLPDKYRQMKNPKTDLHNSSKDASEEATSKKRKGNSEHSDAAQTDTKPSSPKSNVKRKCLLFSNDPSQQLRKENRSKEEVAIANQQIGNTIANSTNVASGNPLEKKKSKQKAISKKRPIQQSSESPEEDESVGLTTEDKVDARKHKSLSMKNSEKKFFPNTQTEKKKPPAVNSKNPVKPVCDTDSVVLLPQGEEMKTVAGIELSADDIGPALQLLEFCSAFGKVLDLRKGYAESILRELIRGRAGRHGLFSSLAQFHTKLFDLLQNDMEEGSPVSRPSASGNSWLKQLHKCICESPYALKDLPFGYLNRGPDEYSKLDPSQKLRVLNFLCDEAIGTERLRNLIEEENSKFLEKKKEYDENLAEVNKKEKDMKQKLKDQMARMYLSSRDGADISITENLGIVSKIRKATDEAHAEKMKALEMKSKLKNNRSDAVRTEHIVFDKTGRIYWRLVGDSSGSRIMLQDVGNRESISSQDKWFIYDGKQEKALEKYIFSLRQRCKLRKANEIAHAVIKENLQHGSPIDSSSPSSAVEDAKV